MSKKDSTAVRLDSRLLAEARAASEIEHRSPAKQIEYWATVGRLVSRSLAPGMLREILSGTARVVTEPIEAPAPDFDAVMAAVDADTRPPRERVGLSPEAPVYRASKDVPGYLERIDPDGSVDIGVFDGGEFRSCHREALAAVR